MPVQPRAGLPAGFTTEPATGAHAPEVFELLAAERIAAFGFCPDSLEDVRANLEPTESQAVEHLVRDPHGSLMQWWVAITDPGEPIFYSWIASHPRLPTASTTSCPRGMGHTVRLDLRNGARWGRPDRGAVRLRGRIRAGASAAARCRVHPPAHLLGDARAGQRGDPHRPAGSRPDHTASEDTRAIYEVFDKGFKDHWGYVEVPYDDWAKVQPTFSGYDPRLWFLAEVDGAPAAAMTLSRRVEADGAMYVQQLATLEGYRRRGIASALLAHAFDIAGREGLTQLSLHVDSESTHNAPSVYLKAGLQVRCAFHAHVRDVQR